MSEVYWWTLKDVREKVFANKIALATLQKLVNAKKIPSERFGTKKIFIPDWWVRQQIEIGHQGESNA